MMGLGAPFRSAISDAQPSEIRASGRELHFLGEWRRTVERSVRSVRCTNEQ